MILPEFSGGRLDAEGGKAARLAALRKFEALGGRMRLPVFLTLTPDRENFAGPEAAYDACSLKLSELLSQRLGIAVWARVAEVQTKSGDGWIHWHVLADVGGTRFDLSGVKGRPWIDLGALRSELMQSWCGLWKLGGVGGQDVQPVRKREAVAGYLSKYVAKPWPAIPTWVLDRTFLRTVGFSRGANQLLRAVGVVRESASPGAADDGADEDDAEPEPVVKKRPVRKLLERLALSGLASKVVAGKRYVGQLACSVGLLSCLVPDLQRAGIPIRLAVKTYDNGRWGVREVCRPVLERCDSRILACLNRFLEARGWAAGITGLFHERLCALLDGWDSMQAAASPC